MMRRDLAKKIIITLVALIVCQASFAAGLLFNVSAVGNTLNIKTTASHIYPSVGIMLNTNGYSLAHAGTECSLGGSSGYCLFSANQTTPKLITIAGPAGVVNFTLCLNGVGATSCQNYHATIAPPPPPSHPNAAYITNGDNIVSSCDVNDNGTFGLCIDAGASEVFITPRGIALNNDIHAAYVVTNGDDAVHLCTINAMHVFETCAITANTGFAGAEGLAVNHIYTYGYVSNANADAQTVTSCIINPDGTWGACTNAGAPACAFFSQPRGMAVNNTNDIVYVANYGTDEIQSSVSRCAVDAGGVFSSCLDSGNDGVLFNGAFGIALNPFGTFAYVTNNNNDTVSVCPINAITGAFGTCVDSGNTGVLFNGPAGIAINAAGTFAYVANGATNAILVCPINQVNGTFGACIDSGSTGLGFVSPVFLTLTPSLI
jgi:DNA-binding beta-propeller fold protein YncE